jgi:hypothetical protein
VFRLQCSYLVGVLEHVPDHRQLVIAEGAAVKLGVAQQLLKLARAT